MKGRVWQHPSGDWIVILNLGKHPDGRRNCPWVARFGPTEKKKADECLVEKLYELQKGLYIDKDNVTVAEWGERWLAHYVKHRVADTTEHYYGMVVNGHIIEAIGAMKMQKVAKPHLQALVSTWSDTMKPSTVRLYATVLKAMFREAVDSGILYRNPADRLNLPKLGTTERRALSVEEMNDLLAKLQGSRLYLPTLLALTTGLRRGEVLGLKWSSIEGNVLTVTQQITERGVHDPKSAAGRRRITLPQATVEALKAHKRQQAEDRLAAGRAWHDQGYVLTGANGEPWTGAVLTQAFLREMKKLGLDLCFHELRHTHGSQLLANGYSVNLVAERLGHNPSETLRTYAHVLPGGDAMAAETMDGLLASTASK